MSTACLVETQLDASENVNDGETALQEVERLKIKVAHRNEEAKVFSRAMEEPLSKFSDKVLLGTVQQIRLWRL